ncbi:MAG: glycosyltransferase family 4 protein [Thiohalospira sp.]
MKVLFVSSGNKGNNPGKPGAVVYNQGESLKNAGVEVDYFLIEGKGLFGYLKNIRKIAAYLKNNSFDIIHAHYSLTAFVTSLALMFCHKTPLIVSLMGSDTKLASWNRFLVQFCSRFLWSKIIVKSQTMQRDAGLKNSLVLPNGVNIEKINSIHHKAEKLSLADKQVFGKVLFAADPSRESKNYPLAKKAMEHIAGKLNIIFNKPHEEVLEAIIKTNVVLLTSRWEGSPNIIKEAMACNTPIVATVVGDIRWLFGNEPGHYICSFEPEDVAQKIEKALDFAKKYGKTNGRQRILELGLDEKSIAGRLVEVYEEAIEKVNKF